MTVEDILDLHTPLLNPHAGEPDPLERFLKRYRKRRSVMEPIYRQMILEANRLARPQAVTHIYKAEEVPQIAAYMQSVEYIDLGVCTIGPEIEARIRELSREKLASAMVLDEVGTAMVIELGCRMHQAARSGARTMNMRASPSFRPGIGHWPLKLQEELFHLLPVEEIGVSLTESLMMSPQKSLSMIVGIGTNLQRSRAPEKSGDELVE